MATTQETQALNLAVSMFNAAPGAEILAVIVDYINTNGIEATQTWLAEIANPLYTGTNEDKATSMLANFGLSKGTDGGDLAYDYFLATLNGGKDAGTVLAAASDYLNLTSAADLATAGLTDAKAVLDNKVDVAEYYSITKAQSSNDMATLQAPVATVDATAASVMAAESAVDAAVQAAADAAADAETFALTASAGLGEFMAVADGGLFTGTDLDDTFLAQAGQTENAIMQGGAGLDTLKATLDATDDGVAPSTTDVEVFMLRNTNANTEISLIDAIGLEAVYSDRSSADLDLIDVTSDIQLGMKRTDTVLTVTYDDVTGDEDVALLRLDGSEAGAEFIAAGVETVKVLVESDSDVDLTTNTYTTVEIIEGSGDLELNTLDTATTTLTAGSLYTGDLTVVAGAGTDTTITAGAGNDSITANGAGDLTIDAGAGDDTIDMIATLTVDDVIDGGAGDDTVKLTVATSAAALTQATGDVITNVETLAIYTTDGGATTVTLDADFTTATNLTFVSEDDAADSFTVTDTTGEALTFTNATDATNSVLGTITVGLKEDSGTTALGTAESVTLNIANTDKDTSMTVATVAIDEVENVTLNFTANADIEALATNVTEIDVAAITTNEIEVLTITGDAQDVELGSGTALTMETITSTATSNIEIDLGSADQAVTLGAGDDTIVMGANSTADDVIDGGEGDDTMTVTVASGVSAVSAKTTNVENVEVTMALTQANATDVTDSFDASNLVGADITLIKGVVTSEGSEASADLNIYALTGLEAGADVTLSGSFTDAEDTSTVSLALKTATGSSDSINVILDTNQDNDDAVADAITQDIDALSIQDIETVNLTIAEDGIETITTTISSLALDNTDTTSLVLSGPSDTLTGFEITAFATDGALTSIDASGISGALTLGEMGVGGIALTLGNQAAAATAVNITLDSTEAKGDTVSIGDSLVGDIAITNFTVGAGITADTIDLSAYGITSIEELDISDDGTDTTIDLVATDANFGSIELSGVTDYTTLVEANFIFAS